MSRSLSRRALPLSFAVVLVALAAAACTHTGVNSAEGWNVVKTRHFTMYTATAQRHDWTLNGLEFHHAAFSGSFFSGAEMSNIDVLFVEEDDFLDLMGNRRQAAALARVPGNGKIGKDGLIIVKPHSGNNQAYNAEALSHIFIHRMLPQAPLWFHEGFAAYLKAADYRETGGTRVACFGRPGVSDVTFIPLDKFFSLNWDEYDGGEARSWYKHTGRMLIDLILHGDNGQHRGALDLLLNGFSRGATTPELMKAAFPNHTPQTLAKRVVDHGTDVLTQAQQNPNVRGICPLPFKVSEEHAPDISDRAMNPAEAADIRVLLDGIKRLPLREDGYPMWFPEEIIVRSEAGGGAK
jgi:hypothetical protein